MPRLRTDPIRVCSSCGVTEGMRITRSLKEPERWSEDVSLHFAASDQWKRPAKVIMRKRGLCQWCSESFRGKVHPLTRQPFLTCKTEPTHE